MAISGSRVGFIWIYGIIVLFATGIIELIIIPALNTKLVPALIQSATATLSVDDVTAYTAQVNQVINFMHVMIYFLMFIVLVYMIVSIFKKEEQEIYYQP